jgi:hypothetical protein
MKLTHKSGAKIAMTAAALVVSGTALIATAMADPIPGRCFGVNGCAGKGACKSAKNDCKGKNACKGQGWLSMLQEECDKAGGQFQS